MDRMLLRLLLLGRRSELIRLLDDLLLRVELGSDGRNPEVPRDDDRRSIELLRELLDEGARRIALEALDRLDERDDGRSNELPRELLRDELDGLKSELPRGLLEDGARRIVLLDDEPDRLVAPLGARVVGRRRYELEVALRLTERLPERDDLSSPV
jgi:hypothetical protein